MAPGFTWAAFRLDILTGIFVPRALLTKLEIYLVVTTGEVPLASLGGGQGLTILRHRGQQPSNPECQ